MMLKLPAVLLIMCMLGASRGGYLLNNCRGLKGGKEVDHRLILGNWYVFGVTHSRWSKCAKYFITVDENSDYYIREDYLPTSQYIFSEKSVANYDLKYNNFSPELKMTTKLLGYVPFWETWTLASSDNNYEKYMLLYKCGWILEESQIWIRDSNFTTDSSRAPEEVLSAIQEIGFKESDFIFKKSQDC